jgi:hypothetical protein
MKTIHKHTLKVNDEVQILNMRELDEVVHVACQYGAAYPDRVMLWVLTDTDMPPKQRGFRVFGTGHAIPPKNHHYVGSGITPGGDLVWHVMELR